MIAMLHRGGFTRAQYDERFSVGYRTWRRDISTLWDAGLYVTAPVPNATDRRYTLTYFRSYAEAS